MIVPLHLPFTHSSTCQMPLNKKIMKYWFFLFAFLRGLTHFLLWDMAFIFWKKSIGLSVLRKIALWHNGLFLVDVGT